MKNLLVVTFCLCSAVCWVVSGVITVSAKEREEVRIECSHSNAGSNEKYFCGGECGYEDILIKTDSGDTYKTNGRFSLQDHGSGTFTVTITALKMSDTGTYWCGIERTGADTYTEVHLTVTEAPTTTPQTTTSTATPSTAPPPGTTAYYQETHTTGPLFTSMTMAQKQTDQRVYVAVGLGVAALVFGVAVAVIIGARCKAGNSEEAVSYNIQNPNMASRDIGSTGKIQDEHEGTFQRPATDTAVDPYKGTNDVTSKSKMNDDIYQNFTPSSLDDDLIYENTIHSSA